MKTQETSLGGELIKLARTAPENYNSEDIQVKELPDITEAELVDTKNDFSKLEALLQKKGRLKDEKRENTDISYSRVSIILGQEGGLKAISDPDLKGRTALSYAAERGHIKLMEMIIEAASKEPGLVSKLIKMKDIEGKSPLDYAKDSDVRNTSKPPKVSSYLDQTLRSNANSAQSTEMVRKAKLKMLYPDMKISFDTALYSNDKEIHIKVPRTKIPDLQKELETLGVKKPAFFISPSETRSYGEYFIRVTEADFDKIRVDDIIKVIADRPPSYEESKKHETIRSGPPIPPSTQPNPALASSSKDEFKRPPPREKFPILRPTQSPATTVPPSSPATGQKPPPSYAEATGQGQFDRLPPRKQFPNLGMEKKDQISVDQIKNRVQNEVDKSSKVAGANPTGSNQGNSRSPKGRG